MAVSLGPTRLLRTFLYVVLVAVVVYMLAMSKTMRSGSSSVLQQTAHLQQIIPEKMHVIREVLAKDYGVSGAALANLGFGSGKGTSQGEGASDAAGKGASDAAGKGASDAAGKGASDAAGKGASDAAGKDANQTPSPPADTDGKMGPAGKGTVNKVTAAHTPVPPPKDTPKKEEEKTAKEPETTFPPNSCPEIPPGLQGKWVPIVDVVSWEVQEKNHTELESGGRWRPSSCTARHRVAVLIPYRSRDEHLHIFMNNMHGFLQRQQLDYGIYVIEQDGTGPFNRATLFNVGFKEAMGDYDWQCIVLHDVDHIPMNDQNMYSCPRLPRHLSVAVEKHRFRMPYRNYFGGVSMMKSEHYQKINGGSNVYWGWGAEDDDYFKRCESKGLVPILRYPANVGKYKTIQKFHKRATMNNGRMKLLRQWKQRQDKDGLSDLKYKVVKKEYRKLFTYILTDIGHLKR